MRTTLTLDPDVVRLLEEAVHREHRPTKQVVNDALRRALGPSRGAEQQPYVTHPHESEIRAGVDGARLNQLADELEDEATVARWDVVDDRS